MEPELLTKDYLEEGRVMQLATSAGGQPWICTVYYVIDEKMNIYWLSLPTRRHSQEIALNNKAAITVPVKFDIPVIGVQAEGTATVVNDPDLIKPAIKKYIKKYDSGKAFYENFISGKNQHVMYCLVPNKIVLFDEVNFPGVGRREIKF